VRKVAIDEVATGWLHTWLRNEINYVATVTTFLKEKKLLQPRGVLGGWRALYRTGGYVATVALHTMTTLAKPATTLSANGWLIPLTIPRTVAL
jgi:hypothetical protein